MLRRRELDCVAQDGIQWQTMMNMVRNSLVLLTTVFLKSNVTIKSRREDIYHGFSQFNPNVIFHKNKQRFYRTKVFPFCYRVLCASFSKIGQVQEIQHQKYNTTRPSAALSLCFMRAINFLLRLPRSLETHDITSHLHDQ